MDRTTATNFTVLFMFLNLLFWTFVWEPLATTLHMQTLTQLSLLQVVLFLIPCGLYLFFTKSSPQKMLRFNGISAKNAILVILIAITVQPTMALLSFLSSFLFQNNVSTMLYENSDANLFLLLISVALIPAICEEFFFRGIVFSNFCNLRLSKACCITGFYFSLMHMDLQQIVYTFGIGVLFCFLVYRTDTILASILAHFTINTTQTILTTLSFRLEQQGILSAIENLLMPKGQFYSIFIWFVCSLPFLIGFFWIFFKSTNPTPVETELGFLAYHPNRKCKEDPFDILFGCIIAIYVLFTVVPFVFSFL